MKSFVLVFTLVASSAFASSKVCFFPKERPQDKADFFTAEISKQEITIKNVVGENAWDGTFTNKDNNVVKGKDGKIYLDFDAHGDDGCSTILVDQVLTKSGTSGQIKFQCRGEGFMIYKAFCRDNKR